jgi:hypothetical protein
MASKRFKIKYQGVDGNSTDSFSSLADAGKFLASRFQGCEYIKRENVMGTDYADYVLVGFQMQDVGKFSYHDGYRDFQFFDWAGGTLVEIKKFTVFAQDDSEYADKRVLASFDTLDEAIAKAVKLCSDNVQIYVEEGDKYLGYAVDKQWIENLPFEEVAFQNESESPF